MNQTNRNFFECSNCGAQYTKWVGRCLECGKWGTIAKSKVESQKSKVMVTSEYAAIETVSLKEIEGKNVERVKTDIGELDGVLGGGLVPGSVILLGGEPGVGKSTLALQLASILPHSMYISGEESVEQIKLRAERLNIKSDTLRLGNATNVESIVATIVSSRGVTSRSDEGSTKSIVIARSEERATKQSPRIKAGTTIQGDPSSSLLGMTQGTRLVIIDSIQTIHSDEVEGGAGNVSQVRACAAKLMELAKATGVIIVLIGQVTKDGAVAGPKTLEHLVDVVLYLEGDKYHNYRVLRTAKNRFGSTDEIGVFSMEEHGLQEVKNPSAVFLSGRTEEVPGSAVSCLMEGTRPMLVEIQALVTKTNFGYPQRRASGFDLNRLQVLIGVLSKRTGLPLESYDVYLNVVGGLSAEEPAADLAVMLAIASGLHNKTLPKNMAAFGEVGLGGEVRAVSHTKRRLEEIKKMGFEFAVVPAVVQTGPAFAEATAGKHAMSVSGIKIAQVKNVKELVEKIVK